MPFSFTWTNTDPADPTAANLLGKDIRDLRGAIQERMDSIFCDPSGPWLTSDPTHPLIAAPGISGLKTGKKLTIPHTAFVAPPVSISGFFGGNTTGVFTYTDLYASIAWTGNVNSGRSDFVYAPVMLPNNVTVTKLNVFADPRTTTAIVATLQLNSNYDTPAGYASTVVATATTPAASGLVSADSAAVSVTATTVTLWYIKVSLPTAGFTNESGRIYGCQVTYNSLDSTTTY